MVARVTILRLAALTLTTIVDLAVAIVVFAVAFGFGGLVICAVVLIIRCAAILPTTRAVTPLFCAVAHARLFGAIGGNESIVDLAVAIVVFAVALGLDSLVIGILSGIRSGITIFPATCPCAALFGSDARALLFRAKRRSQVVVDLAVAIVVFAVALGLDSLVICVMSGVFGVCAIFPTTRSPASLFGSAAHALLFRAKRCGQVVVDLAVAIVVFAIALGLDGLIISVLVSIRSCIAIFPTIRTITGLPRAATNS